ncbi:TPA: N-acetylmuramic acid 6-phosphate etherase [Streptococcus suis]
MKVIKLEGLSTETRNPLTMALDTMSVKEILTVMNEEDAKVPAAIQPALPDIEAAVLAIDEAFKAGGRLIYMGAGTSGRLGILDAVECVPTFGTPADMVQGLIAGGEKAVMAAVEGAEDDADLGKSDLVAIDFRAQDILVGLAASGRTPYVLGGLAYAKSIGAKTIAIACNRNSQIGAQADIAIEVEPGPEVLTGSTRLKAGTAQKLILNMLSTTAMILQGKVYQNLMVDVIATNQKLVKRSESIVQSATGASLEDVQTALSKSQGNVKEAILMILLDLDHTTAQAALEKSQGHLRPVIENKG